MGSQPGFCLICGKYDGVNDAGSDPLGWDAECRAKYPDQYQQIVNERARAAAAAQHEVRMSIGHYPPGRKDRFGTVSRVG